MAKWKYAWESPDPKRWKSTSSFDSFKAARDNAVYCARMARRKKHYINAPLDKGVLEKLWRSMKSSGWRIRKKESKTVDP